MTDSSHKIPEIESLRGWLALWVVIGHIFGISGFMPNDIPVFLRPLALNQHAVEVFMIVSGFVIFMLIDRQRETYSIYLIRRFLRIYPIFLVCLLVGYWITPMVQELLTTLNWHSTLIDSFIRTANDSVQYRDKHLFAHLTLLHGLVPNQLLPSSDFALLGPAWSLSLEWQFYLIAPLIFFLLKTTRGIALLVAVLLIFSVVHTNRIAFFGTQFSFFFVGIASYFLWKRKPYLANIPYTTWRYIAISGIFFTFVITQSFALVVWVAFFIACLMFRVRSNSPESILFGKIFLSNWMQIIGKTSYSIYLAHMPIVYLTAQFLTSHFTGIEKQQFLFATFAIVIPSTIALSLLLFKFVENPFMVLGKRIAMNKIKTEEKVALTP